MKLPTDEKILKLLIVKLNQSRVFPKNQSAYNIISQVAADVLTSSKVISCLDKSSNFKGDLKHLYRYLMVIRDNNKSPLHLKLEEEINLKRMKEIL